ncbi:MAG TPA: slipin family protein [bacterium]|nr:slipin family protein [bacterium]
MESSLIVLVVLVLGFIFAGVRILPEYERGVIFRLGRAIGVKGPGLIILIPLVDRMTRVSLRTMVLDIPPQDVITKDNVSIKVNAVNYSRVVDPFKAIIEVEDFLYATSQLAQTTLRAVLGQVELDQLLSDREAINQRLQVILDTHTEPWGIKVAQVEVKDIDLPKEMQSSLARQAQAERDRRAKVIMAQAEQMAAQALLDASEMLARNPVAIQLRFLQTLTEMAASPSNSTIIPVPVPMDVLAHLLGQKGKDEAKG